MRTGAEGYFDNAGSAEELPPGGGTRSHRSGGSMPSTMDSPGTVGAGPILADVYSSMAGGTQYELPSPMGGSPAGVPLTPSRMSAASAGSLHSPSRVGGVPSRAVNSARGGLATAAVLSTSAPVSGGGSARGAANARGAAAASVASADKSRISVTSSIGGRSSISGRSSPGRSMPGASSPSRSTPGGRPAPGASPTRSMSGPMAPRGASGAMPPRGVAAMAPRGTVPPRYAGQPHSARTTPQPHSARASPPQPATARRLGGSPASPAVRGAAPPPGVAPQSARRSTGTLSVGSYGGYPRRIQERQSLQDMKAELERMRRETREMKATETQVQAQMQREEEKHRALEKERDQQEILEWRKQQRDETVAYADERKLQQNTDDMQDSREYQAYKRSLKEAEKDQEQHDIRCSYIEHKDNAMYNAELKKLDMADLLRVPVEENLEKYRTLAEAKLYEKQCEDWETQEARLRTEQSELEHSMLLAKQEREEAMHGLEFIRAHQFEPVPEGRDLAVR